MMGNFDIPPVSVLFREATRKIVGSKELQHAAFRTETIWPAEASELPLAAYLADDLLKITGTFHGDSREGIDREIKAATEADTRHSSCLAFHLKNAIVYDGSAYCRSYKHSITSRTGSAATPVRLRQAAIVSTSYGSKYFGHWLSDDCLQYALATETGTLPIQISLNNYPHQARYAEWFEQGWGNHTAAAQVDDLIIYQDFSQSSFKQKRIQKLRDSLRSRIESGPSGRLVYLKRGSAGSKRTISNEHEIEDYLSKNGFNIAETSDQDPSNMIAALAGARLVVSMEGSHSVPAMFALPTNGALLQLQPQDRFTGIQRGLTYGAGITRFGFTVGTKRNNGHEFDVNDIMRVADKLLR